MDLHGTNARSKPDGKNGGACESPPFLSLKWHSGEAMKLSDCD